MRVQRPTVLLACFALVAGLTACGADGLDVRLAAAPAATAHVARPLCDARCAAYVTGEVAIWQRARAITLERQWFAAVFRNTREAVCVRGHESANVDDGYGGYAAYDGSGNFGAYQFDLSTWNAVNAEHGRYDLVGVAPLAPRVAWWDQDGAAAWLYAERGDQPWGNRC